MPFAFRNSIDNFAGAHPLAFNPYSFPVFASYTITNKSPPIPFIIGSTTPIIAFVAIAASTAFPPLSKIRTPACEASGDSEATIPPREITMDRVCPRSCPSTSQLVNTKPPTKIKIAIARTGHNICMIPLNHRKQRPHLTSPANASLQQLAWRTKRIGALRLRELGRCSAAPLQVGAACPLPDRTKKLPGQELCPGSF